MNEWINGCTLDEGKTRNTRTTWTLPSLSFSACVVFACVVLPGGTNRYLSPSVSVTHLLKSKEEEEEKHTRGQQTDWRRRGCGEVVCAGVSGSWLMSMARSNGLWPLLPMVGLFLVYTSVHAIAKLDIHLLDNGELLISFVFSYFFYFLFF